MGQLMSLGRTEPVCFLRPTLVPDGASGNVEGEPITHKELAEVKATTQKRIDEGGQVMLRSGYTLRRYNNQAFLPQNGDSVVVRGKTLAVLSVAEDDVQQRIFKIIALEKAALHG